LRAKLQDFTTEQKRLADEAERQRQAEERRVRQEAEAKAAAERAKAEQIAAEQRRQAEAAEAARRKAEAEGNAKAAARAAAEAATLQEKAVATIENADAKAAETIMAAQAALQLPPATAEKVAGFSLRDNWKAELHPGKGEYAVIALIVEAIANGRSDLLALLKLDMSAADKLAKALKGAMNVPGMLAVNRQTSVSRAA
jgi:hypothetical protein